MGCHKRNGSFKKSSHEETIIPLSVNISSVVEFYTSYSESFYFYEHTINSMSIRFNFENSFGHFSNLYAKPITNNGWEGIFNLQVCAKVY